MLKGEPRKLGPVRFAIGIAADGTVHIEDALLPVSTDLVPPVIWLGRKIIYGDKYNRRWTPGRIVGAVIILSVTGAIFVTGALLYRGHCFEKGRSMTATEKFDAAIEDVIKARGPRGGYTTPQCAFRGTRSFLMPRSKSSGDLIRIAARSGRVAAKDIHRRASFKAWSVADRRFSSSTTSCASGRRMAR